jgi:hypothetical protein
MYAESIVVRNFTYVCICNIYIYTPHWICDIPSLGNAALLDCILVALRRQPAPELPSHGRRCELSQED